MARLCQDLPSAVKIRPAALETHIGLVQDRFRGLVCAFRDNTEDKRSIDDMSSSKVPNA